MEVAFTSGKFPEVLVILRSHGCTLSNEYVRPRLMQAINQGNLNAVRPLIESAANKVLVLRTTMDENGRNPLMLAVTLNNVELAKYFLESGSEMSTQDAAGNTLLSEAKKHNNDALLKLLNQQHSKGAESTPPLTVEEGVPKPTSAGSKAG
eukprot:TRINITY_DN64595_c0_g1_i1.p2 TRINITY_DN64595_c0_g1~~TRINITY_DN64595_c0_g1_i1.p2  ORF type:complete len:151 (+),score=20.74 TRINITY_DN64595_c0_g1_i1:1430-1882(+)